jgi:hypothetical protein
MPEYQGCKAVPADSRDPDIPHHFFNEILNTAIRIAGCGNCRLLARYDFSNLTISSGVNPSWEDPLMNALAWGGNFAI